MRKIAYLFYRDEPELRFPEFSEPWKRSKLKDICNIQDGTHSTPKYTEEGIPFFSVDTIINNIPPKFISKEEHEKLIKRCFPKKGDILLSRITGGILGYSKLVDWDYEFSIYVSLALLSSIKINPKYLNQYLKTEHYRKDFFSKSLLIAVPPKINLNDLAKTKVKYPSLEEQDKIANFLDFIDKKIELLEKKYEKYISFKKYLMNFIFSEEYMFKMHEYKTFKLGEISKINTGKKDVKDKKDNGKYPFFVRSEKIEKIDSYSFDGEAILIPGDGKIGEVYHYINGKFDYHQRVYKISNFNEHTNGKYVFYYLQKFFLKHALKNTAKATVDSLRLKTLTNMKIELPSMEQQIKIVKILSLADKIINLLEKDLENIKEFKKALVQKMFV